jgi:very-short-patch-repair endonuclease
MTDAERILWRHLRNRALGVTFRRQHPIEPYVADFACLTAHLVIEVDGGQHAGSERDLVRAAFLKGEGFRVLRFWNNEVLGNTASVLEVIREHLSAPK